MHGQCYQPMMNEGGIQHPVINGGTFLGASLN